MAWSPRSRLAIILGKASGLGSSAHKPLSTLAMVPGAVLKRQHTLPGNRAIIGINIDVDSQARAAAGVGSDALLGPYTGPGHPGKEAS